MANSSQNETELLEASIRGNTAAFESIVKKYQSFVCAITFSAIPDVEKSEDMAQETFLHAWNNLSKLKDLTKFKSWLISIARNVISDSLRKQKRDLINKAAPIDQVEDTQFRKCEPAQHALSKEQQAVVQSALMQIPEKYRESLVLFYRHEKSVKNIAEQLDLSEELVKQHLSRGRKLLREQVASIVEKSISRTGPTKAFTSIVMASIVGLAVKSSGAAAAAAGSTAIASGISAKIITAAAVIAIGIGSVVTYSHFTKTDENNQTTTPVTRTNEIPQVTNSDNSLPAANMNITANTIQESTRPDIASEIYAKNTITENISNNINALSSNNSSIINTIALKNKPNESPYEYFLFTRYNRESSTKTLILAHVKNGGIELKDIITQPESNYHWGNPICVTGGKLYCGSYNYIYSIDLSTKQTEEFPLRPNKTPDYVFNFTSSALEICFADNCIYGLAKKGDITTLRQIDFEKGAYRDIANVTKVQPSRNIAISPDNKQLAYFAMDPNGNYPSSRDPGNFLTIVNIESGKITQTAKPIQFLVPLGASSFPGIPIIWLDTENVAFIRSEIPEGENQFSLNRSGVNKLSMVNVNTGMMVDITSMPGNIYGFSPDLIQDNVGVGPLVQPQTDKQGSYRLDLKNRKLVENDLIADNYRHAFEHLYYKDEDLGPVKGKYFKVSPDGSRIIWMTEQPAISITAQNKEAAARAVLTSGNGQLYYYDEAQDAPAAVATVYNTTGVWLKAEDLRAQLSKSALSAEWTPLEDISKNLPKQTYTDMRKNIRDYFTCTITTDKNTYLLHEPVQVTLTFTNKSSSDVTTRKPYVIESIMRPLAGLILNYPGGQKSIDCGAQPYCPADENILLKAGESFIATDTIEVNAAGNYSLEYKYEISPVQQEYKGNITTEPAEFNVLSVNDSEKEKQLFEAKFARIMNRFHKETAMDPNWYGNNNVVDEVTGLPGMGPAAAPYIIKAIDSETNKNSRQLLLKALGFIADSQYISYFKERLINDETEPVCNWLLKIYRQSRTDKDARQQALDALIAGMSNKDIKARREVCTYLTRIYDKSVETCLEKATEDEDEKIRMDAGFYLAAAKWLDLTEWLKLVESKTDYVNYISASVVIKKLEQQFNISKGNVPVLSKEDFTIAERIQEAEQYYKEVLNDWLSWSQENSRASFLFFEDYRRTWWENDPLRQE